MYDDSKRFARNEIYIEGGRNNGYYTHDAEFSADLESDTYIVNDSHHRQLVG